MRHDFGRTSERLGVWSHLMVRPELGEIPSGSPLKLYFLIHGVFLFDHNFSMCQFKDDLYAQSTWHTYSLMIQFLRKIGKFCRKKYNNLGNISENLGLKHAQLCEKIAVEKGRPTTSHR